MVANVTVGPDLIVMVAAALALPMTSRSSFPGEDLMTCSEVVLATQVACPVGAVRIMSASKSSPARRVPRVVDRLPESSILTACEMPSYFSP